MTKINSILLLLEYIKRMSISGRCTQKFMMEQGFQLSLKTKI